MFEKDQEYFGDTIEEIVRKRFEHIINGEGAIIPRIAVRVAVDSLFEEVGGKDGL